MNNYLLVVLVLIPYWRAPLLSANQAIFREQAMALPELPFLRTTAKAKSSLTDRDIAKQIRNALSPQGQSGRMDDDSAHYLLEDRLQELVRQQEHRERRPKAIRMGSDISLKAVRNWADRFRAAKDPMAFIASQSRPTRAQSAVLRMAHQEFLQALPQGKIFFADPDSLIGKTFVLDEKRGTLVICRDIRGRVFRFALVSSRDENLFRQLLTVIHEGFHFLYYPTLRLRSRFESKLHEGLTDFFVREAMARVLRYGRSPAAMQIRQWARGKSPEYRLLARIFDEELPTNKVQSEEFKTLFNETASYPRELAVIDSLSQTMSRTALVRLYHENRFEELYSRFPGLLIVKKMAENVLYNVSVLEAREIWSRTTKIIQSGSSGPRERTWKALIQLTSWFRLDSEKVDFYSLPTPRQIGFFAENDLGLIDMVRETIFRQKWLARWANDLVARKSERAVLKEIRDEIRHVIKELQQKEEAKLSRLSHKKSTSQALSPFGFRLSPRSS